MMGTARIVWPYEDEELKRYTGEERDRRRASLCRCYQCALLCKPRHYPCRRISVHARQGVDTGARS